MDMLKKGPRPPREDCDDVETNHTPAIAEMSALVHIIDGQVHVVGLGGCRVKPIGPICFLSNVAGHDNKPLSRQ